MRTAPSRAQNVYLILVAATMATLGFISPWPTWVLIAVALPIVIMGFVIVGAYARRAKNPVEDLGPSSTQPGR